MPGLVTTGHFDRRSSVGAIRGMFVHEDIQAELETLQPNLEGSVISSFGSADFQDKNASLGPKYGHVVCEGDDATDFLNRLTTIVPKQIDDGAGSPGFLLSHNGKIKVSFELFRHSQTRLSLFCHPTEVDLLHNSLDMFHFGERLTLNIEAPKIAVLVERVKMKALSFFAVAQFENWRNQEGYNLLLLGSNEASEFLKACAIDCLSIGGFRDFERFRIRCAIALGPNEWNDKFTPLDANGHQGIVELKGCYPGQEVIERTIAIGRPARKLVRAQGKSLAVGSSVVSLDGKEIGEITSVTRGGPTEDLGLAIVKSKISLDETYKLGNESVFLTAI